MPNHTEPGVPSHLAGDFHDHFGLLRALFLPVVLHFAAAGLLVAGEYGVRCWNYYITPPEPAYASISTEATPASDPTVDPDLVAAQSTVTALPTPTALLARLARSAQIASITLLPVLIAAGVQTVPVSYWCEIPAPHRGLMGRQIPVPKPVPRECGRCIANGASEAGGWMVWAVFGTSVFWILAELFSPSYPTHAVLIRLISSISTTTLTLAVMGITIGKLKEYKEMGSHCGMQPN